jgi:hypothetical protein
VSSLGRLLLVAILCILPSCGSGTGQSASDASGAGGGDGSREAGGGDGSDASKPVTADFFVSPAGTDTQGCGSITSPCKTVAYTQPLVQALVKTNPQRTVTVLLRGNAGPFWLAAPLSFGSADSGTSTTPVLWGAYPGENPVLSGGIQVTSAWTSASQAGGTLWSTSLPASTVDFASLFINGTRHYTPRAPTTAASGYLYNVGPVCLASVDSTTKSVCKLPDSTPGLCPTATPYECYDRFVYANDDISPAWTNITVGTTHPIVIDDFEDWTVSKLRLSSVDSTNHIAYLTGPTMEEDKFHGFLAGHRYIVENVEDELTSVSGNFYVDESKTPFTLEYFTKAGDDPSKETVIVPQLPVLLETTSSLEYVTFQGLTFSHDDWTVPAVGYPSIQAEPEVTSAVTFVDASHVTIDSAIFTNIQGHALLFKGSGTQTGTGSNTVENSAFYDLGGGGIRLALPTSPGYSLVTGGGRVVAGSPLIFVGNSDDNVVEHNEVYDGYGDGISVCVPDGPTVCPMYGNHFSYNHVHDIKQGVTSDGGGIYLFSYNVDHASTPNIIDHNWVHDIANDPGPGGYGGICLYVDNDSVNVTVEDNVAYRSSAVTMFVNYGHGHTITNNILAFGQKGEIGRGFDVTTTGALTVPAFVASKNIFLWDMNASIPKADGNSAAFPQSPSAWDCFNQSPSDCFMTEFQFASNIYWSLAKGVTAPEFIVAANTTPGPVAFTGTGSWQGEYLQDKGSSYADPGFTNATCPTDDYSFSSMTTANAIGYEAWDYKSAGRTSPVLVAPTLAPAFPLQVPANKCTFY